MAKPLSPTHSTKKPSVGTTLDAVNPSSPSALLSHARSSREIVQDFVPLAESLEWELGQEYLRERGNKAFISDASPVPFVVNNDGTLSRNAAEVFFANLQEAAKVAKDDDEIYVLELGIGVGLFARYFLDHFRDLCLKHKTNYYDRLCYIAADRSQRMLHDVLRHGVLANHPGRYRVRLVDAMEPEKLVRDVMFRGVSHGDAVSPQGMSPSPQPLSPAGRGALRAVFLNYLLDCLPASVLRLEGEAVTQLHVRTCVARNIKLEQHTDMTLAMLQERATSIYPEAKRELLEVYGLFASEYDYRPVDVQALPHGEFVYDYARVRTKRVLHNYGALQSLDKLLALVPDDGFILINDYGQTQVTREDEFEHQRFSLATFVGVNFPLLKAYFVDGKGYDLLEPAGGDEKGIHSRLLSKKAGSDTSLAFQERFAPAAQELLQEPLHKARACQKVGRFELAASFYREAIEKQPGNWVLLNEVSTFLTFAMRDPKAGIDMAKLALRLNPACSAELWNTLGDGLYEFGRTVEARSAYLKGLAVNSSDVRSRYNLAWVYARERNYPAALEMIATALSLDKTGQFRDRLVHKMQEVLGQLTLKNQQEYLLLINLVSKFSNQDKAEVVETAKPAEPEKKD